VIGASPPLSVNGASPLRSKVDRQAKTADAAGFFRLGLG
jgi:hypothetical protein